MEHEIIPADEEAIKQIKEMCDSFKDASEPDGKQKWWGKDCITEHRLEIVVGDTMFIVHTDNAKKYTCAFDFDELWMR